MIIWQERIRKAAAAVAKEREPEWYAAHIEAYLRKLAKKMAKWPAGHALSFEEEQEVFELRKWLEPYEVRHSHAEFKAAWQQIAH